MIEFIQSLMTVALVFVILTFILLFIPEAEDGPFNGYLAAAGYLVGILIFVGGLVLFGILFFGGFA